MKFSNDDILAKHSDHWILRRLYDAQAELVQLRFTLHEVGANPHLRDILDRRHAELLGVFEKYERIAKEKRLATLEVL